MNGRRVIGHGGDTNYFHSELGLLEEEGVGFFVSVNTGGKAALVPRHFVRAFMNHYFPARLPAVKPPADFGARAAKVRRTLPRAPPFLHALREGLRPAGRDHRRPDRREHARHPRTARATAPQYVEVAPGVFREVDGDRTLAFVENGAGQVVGMVGQFAFIPFYKLRWYEGSPFHFTLLGLSLLLLPDRPGLGAAALEERQGGAARRALGPAQPRRCSGPSTWSSSSPSRRSSPRAWTT